ncbi:MAG TPA: HAMP domain-containing sensor histidine kinase, partial [Ktedonobacteraceae bacterium]|nr:HAMP domain-containing sensor histidine kinase [Ktedonobacteraceae bacterium]
MRYLKVLPRLLLDLPAAARFLVVALCAIICQVLYIILAPMAQNPTLLAVPIAIASWSYRWRGAMFWIFVMNVPTWIFYAIRLKNPWLSNSLLLDFLVGDICLVIVALLISSQRSSFERAAESQQQMARTYEQEQRLNKAKDSFIQQMNHELRTPLTALSGYLELLLEEEGHIDAETRSSFLQSAVLSCEELQLLVENILDSLQVGSDLNAPPLQGIDAAELIEETVQQADPRWKLGPRIHLELSKDLLVLAHKQYLRQVLRNLLSNAIKYTPENQPIFIKARRCTSSLSSPEVCISVQDSGPGIPAEERTRIFEPFTRLQRDMLGQVRGSGLGLSISKQLIEGMGGRIWVESSGLAGEGSCFSFTLPAISSQSSNYSEQ